VEKAEGDFRSAEREMRARNEPNYDLACFCAEQCAEKYLKGLLQESGQQIPRTHDLANLLDLLVGKYPELDLLRLALKALTVFAIEFRYPGASATKRFAKLAYLDCALVRESIRRLLKLSGRAKPVRRSR
jgi:HEPN domain-containing protein